MRTYIENHIVGKEETAAKVGSGLLAVYATPQVVALMEHAACGAIAKMEADEEGALTEGETTVGTRMAIDHVKACLPGETVTAKAELTAVEGRKYTFAIEVTDCKGEVLAKAEHTRFKVNAERFMGKLGRQI